MKGLGIAETINMVLLIVTSIGVVVTGAGVVAAYFQLRLNARNQRNIFLKDLLMQLRTDPDVVHVFYQIEYSQFKYSGDFHGTEKEHKTDRLLTMLDLVCEMYLQGAITDKEMGFFDYQAHRVATNPEIRKYLQFLSGFCRQVGVGCEPFSSFQKIYLTGNRGKS